jgi:tRNA(adenine34) deaminase
MIPAFLQAGHRVVAPDLIGFGKSDKPKKEFAHNFSFHRQTLSDLVQRLDLRRIVLVVHECGGLLALTLPMTTPERFKGLLVTKTTLAAYDTSLPGHYSAWHAMCAKHSEYDIAGLFAQGNPQLSAAECAAYAAPFPHRGHRAATRAFAVMVPDCMEHDGAGLPHVAFDYWQNQWRGQKMMAVGEPNAHTAVRYFGHT